MQQTTDTPVSSGQTATQQDLQPMKGVSSDSALQGSALQGPSANRGMGGSLQGSSFTQVAGESTSNLQQTSNLTEQQIAENIDTTVRPKETTGNSEILFLVFGIFLVVGLFVVGFNQFRKSR